MEELACIEPETLGCNIGKGSHNASPWDKHQSYPQFKSDKVILQSHDLFDHLLVNDTSPLDAVLARGLCSRCQKSRKFFCYDCHIPLETTKNLIPVIPELPCKIDIIKHPAEVDGKSTAVHAKLICPNSVELFTYPEMGNYCSDSENTFLVFPGPGSSSLEELSSDFSPSKSYRFVFVDSTWSQSKKILNNEKLKNLRKIRIDNKKTMFWRYQTGQTDQHLATIEAIYHLVVDFEKKVLCRHYDGRFDNLLFLFKFMYQKIHRTYSETQ